MTPQQLIDVATLIQQRWSEALIYPSILSSNENVPKTTLSVDVHKVWPHECNGNIDCTGCCGEYRFVGYIDAMGQFHDREN